VLAATPAERKSLLAAISRASTAADCDAISARLNGVERRLPSPPNPNEEECVVDRNWHKALANDLHYARAAVGRKNDGPLFARFEKEEDALLEHVERIEHQVTCRALNVEVDRFLARWNQIAPTH